MGRRRAWVDDTESPLLVEAEGFAHLHLHLAPRMANAPEHALEVHVFPGLGVAVEDAVPAAERDRLALSVRKASGR